MTHPLARRLAAGAPDWARRPMLAWDRDELSRRRPFVTASEWRAFSTIELPEIVGTSRYGLAGACRRAAEPGSSRAGGTVAATTSHPSPTLPPAQPWSMAGHD